MTRVGSDGSTKDVAGGVRSFIGHGDASKYPRIELIKGGGDQISRVDTTRMKLRVEHLASHLNQT